MTREEAQEIHCITVDNSRTFRNHPDTHPGRPTREIPAWIPKTEAAQLPWAFAWRAIARENTLDSQQTTLAARHTFVVLRHLDTELIFYRSIT